TIIPYGQQGEYMSMNTNVSDGCQFVRAFAKVNLTLDVLGRREDGYHDLASVMQTISLADTLAFREIAEGQTELFCDVPALSALDNLVCQAVEVLREASGCRRGVRVELHKRTPAPGGLGGGSSDAAYTLLALNGWWKLGLGQEDLLALAARLGSDV